jgi:hypothetical protein
MRIIKYIFSVAAIVSLFVACTKDQPDVEVSPVYPVAGEYFVTAEGADSLGTLDALIFNTASNKSDTAWMELFDTDSYGGVIDVKFKVGVSTSKLSFSVAEAEDINNGSIVNVTDGKITLKSVTNLPSKTTSDGISFTIVVDGNTYKCSGFRRTGWLDDGPF